MSREDPPFLKAQAFSLESGEDPLAEIGFNKIMEDVKERRYNN